MIRIEVPGFGILSFCHLVLDLNGTLTLDGTLIPGVRERIGLVAGMVQVHVLTADTLGKAAGSCRDLPVTLSLIGDEDQVKAKRDYLAGLSGGVAAVGNGSNDAGMLADAALGIAVIGPEGASPETVRSADVVVRDIKDGLDLLLNPDRLRATLRR